MTMNRTRFEEALRYIAYGESEKRSEYLENAGWHLGDPVVVDSFIDPVTGDRHEIESAYLIARCREVLTILDKEDAVIAEDETDS